jgi:hypothetical protein
MDTWFRKHDPRRPKDPSALFAFKNGGPLVVLRPENPEKAIAMIPKQGTPSAAAQAAFDKLLNEQPHQFIGYVSKKGAILDKWGREIEAHMKPGDSMVDCSSQFEPPMFMQSGKFHTEMWDGRKVLVLPRPDLKADSNTGIVLESPVAEDRAAIAIRPGCGTEVDCHLPTLNRIITGDPKRHYKNGPANDKPNEDAPPAGGNAR